MNYNNEKANRMFSIFCYGVLVAFSIGTIFGALMTYFIFNYGT